MRNLIFFFFFLFSNRINASQTETVNEKGTGKILLGLDIGRVTVNPLRLDAEYFEGVAYGFTVLEGWTFANFDGDVGMGATQYELETRNTDPLFLSKFVYVAHLNTRFRFNSSLSAGLGNQLIFGSQADLKPKTHPNEFNWFLASGPQIVYDLMESPQPVRIVLQASTDINLKGSSYLFYSLEFQAGWNLLTNQPATER